MSIKKIHIDNSKKAAVESDKWNPNIKELVEAARESSKPKTLLNELFLVVPDDFDHSPISEFKYPHHQLVDGKCVLDRKGVIAAYSRAKQQDVYDGEIKEHIDRHRKELGLIDEENKLNEAISDIDTMFNSLQEAISNHQFKTSVNKFSSLFEANATPAATGTPIAAAPVDQNVAQQQVAEPVQQPTIPVKNVDPTEDTSMNNPIEGPDDRDQDNLDGNQRKEMYQTFADTLMKANNRNVFGTIFDQDVFKSEYKIVPYEMRYFYRLQNPVSVEVGEFKFIPFGTDLLDAQDKYDLGKKMFVFATYNDKPVFFNMLDKTIWSNDDKINDTFDGFIETMIQNNGEFIVPEEDDQQQNLDANVEYEQNPTEEPVEPQGEQPVDDSIGTQMELDQANQPPVDLTQNTAAPTGVNTGLDDQTGNATGPVDNMAPVDLTQQNASVEYDSVLDSMGEFNESMIDDYLQDNGKVDRAKVANYIKTRRFTKQEFETIIKEINDMNGWIGRTYDRKLPKSEWNKDHLYSVAHDAIAHCFNEDYLRYLDEVAQYVHRSEQIPKVAAGVGAAALAGAVGYGLYKKHKKKKKSKNESFDDDIDDLFEEETSGCSREAITARKAAEAEQEIDDMLESLNALAESVAFPNDELDRRNRERQKEMERRRYGEQMF